MVALTPKKYATKQYVKNHTLWNLSFFTLKFLPVDTWYKLNIHKTFRRLPGRLLNVLCEFSLRPVFTGWKICKRAVEKDLWSMEFVLGKYKTRHKKCAKELLKSDHMHWSLFLISIKPKRWVKALLKGVRMHRNMFFFLHRIRHKRLVKELFSIASIHLHMFLISITRW